MSTANGWTPDEQVIRQAPPAPFSEQELLGELDEAIFTFARQLKLVSNPAAIFGLMEHPGPVTWSAIVQLLKFEGTRSDRGLSLEAFRDWTVRADLQDLYDFAFRGIHRYPLSHFATTYTWGASFIIDLSRSTLSRELAAREGLALDVSRCLRTVEIANARVMLEAGKPFVRIGDTDGDASFEAFLTVGQIALLAGVEEATVRSLISRGKGLEGGLPTVKHDSRTVVPIADAKAWLKARGRYQPIKFVPHGAEDDLGTVRFEGLTDLNGYVVARLGHLNLSDKEFGNGVLAALREVRPQAAKAFEASINDEGRISYRHLFVCGETEADDAAVARAVGHVLQLNPELMVLRMREAALHDRLAVIRSEIANVAAGSEAAR